MSITITRHTVPLHQRINHTARLFGIFFPLHLEPYIYELTNSFSKDYAGGYWQFYTLSNGGFFMAPATEELFEVETDNGFNGKLTSDALGLTVCLYAYSHLSFSRIAGFAESCADQYHLIRAYMLEHREVTNILQAID